MPTYNPLAKASYSSQPYAYYGLLSDGDDIVTRSGTIASATGVVVRGTIVNIDPATAAITIPSTAAGCNGILAEDADATSATVPAIVYMGGKFKADAVIWPGALGHGVVSDALRDCGIFLESVIYTDGTLVKSVPTTAEEAEAKKRVDANKATHEKAAKEAEAKAKGEGKEDEPKPSDSPYAHLSADDREKHPEYAEPAVWTGEPTPGEKSEKPAEHTAPAHKGEERSSRK